MLVILHRYIEMHGQQKTESCVSFAEMKHDETLVRFASICFFLDC